MNILKLGLESLVDEGKVMLSGETIEGAPTFKLTSKGLKDLEESKIFQDTPFGRIYLNLIILSHSFYSPGCSCYDCFLVYLRHFGLQF